MARERIIVYTAGIFFALAMALTSYINSTFLGLYLPGNYVGLVYILASTLSVLSLLLLDKILTRFGNRRVSLFAAALLAAALVVLALGENAGIIVAAFTLYILAWNILIASIDIFVEDFSLKNSIGRFRGLYLMLINGAWVLAQILSSSVINKSSYSGIYLLSALFMVLTTVIFILFLRNFRDPEYKKVPVIKTVEFFAENKNVSRIYLINLILKFFFAWMIIYTPIYLHEHIGFGWEKIGIIFTVMLLPFVLLTFPLGKLSDKDGEKKMLMGGFLITAFFTLLIPFLHSPSVWLWDIVLFGTRVGAATVEVMSESYFFKAVPEEDAEDMAFFRNTAPLSFILAPLVATPLLLILPDFSYLFLVLGVILLFGYAVTRKLEDIL